MIDGLFDIALDTPKYHKRGTLSLKSNGDKIDAQLNVGEAQGIEFTGNCADKEFDFVGEGDFPLLEHVEYQAHGSVWGNSVSITVQSNVGKIELFGTRLSSATGSARSSHEYIMTASTGDVLTNDDMMYSGFYADGG